MGMGSVLYHSNEYEFAGRCFLSARHHRESNIGPDHPDTATAYNNIACCMMKIGRLKEATDYFKLAYLIFVSELGSHHERTMTVQRNIRKSMKGTFEAKVPYKQMYQFYFKDRTSKVGIGGKVGKGKKKRRR